MRVPKLRHHVFQKKSPNLHLSPHIMRMQNSKLSPTLVRPSPDTPTNLIYLKVLGMARCWLVGYLPLWKMTEFVRLDDDMTFPTEWKNKIQMFQTTNQ